MELLQNVLYAIITAAVPVLTAFACRYLQSLYEKNKEKIKNEKVQIVLDQVTDMITNTVQTTTSTYVKELKANNLFDADAQKEAFKRTYEAITKQLTDDAKKIIVETYGDIETYLTNKIEPKVEELK